MRILIADDDAVSLLALQAVLKKRDHSVVVAEDGARAWQHLQTDDPPPLAIFDWLMPGLDGVELCRRIRAEPRLRSLYVLLLTSRGTVKRTWLKGWRPGPTITFASRSTARSWRRASRSASTSCGCSKS